MAALRRHRRPGQVRAAPAAEQRRPHPGQGSPGGIPREVPEGGAELAVAEDILNRGAVPNQCPAATALAGVDTFWPGWTRPDSSG